MKKGVLVGCDFRSEWLLSWWWDNYIQENTLPVTFADFGMSESARSLCLERGSILEVPSNQVAPKETIALTELKKWENSYSQDVWEARNGWFQKPRAMSLSPYEITLWLDLDCEVLGSLLPLYELPKEYQIALAKEPEHGQEVLLNEGFRLEGEIIYNSGVVVFRKQASVIKRWEEESLLKTDSFVGDQNLLSRIIFMEKYPVAEIPPVYNWRMAYGPSLDAVIIHWVGWGKQYIKHYGGLRNLKKQLSGRS